MKKPTSEWLETGKRLREIELAEGQNGNTMARLLGVDFRMWSKYKGGEHELPVWVAAELRRLYGVSLEWLYLGEWHTNSDTFKQRLEVARRVPRPPRSRGRPQRQEGSDGL